MRKIISLTVIQLLFSIIIYGQTNTFPASGNVGIGTLSPTEKLQVNGKILTSQGIKFADGSQQTSADAIWKVIDNGNADDAGAIQTALNNNYQVSLLPNKTYYINSTITIPSYKTLNIPQNTRLLYGGSSSTAIIMNNWSVLTGKGKVECNRSQWNWPDSKVAIKVYGWSVNVDIGWISGFEYGVYLSDNKQIITSKLNVDNFWNCLICIFIYPTNSGFVNNNYFHIGGAGSDWKDNDLTTWENYSTGIYMDCSGSHEPNANTFSGCIGSYKTGIRLAGSFNRIEGLRLEGCSTKISIVSVKINNIEQTRNNYLFGEYDNYEEWWLTPDAITNGTSKTLGEVIQIYGAGGKTLLNNLDVSASTVLNNLSVLGTAYYKSRYWTLSDKNVKTNINSVTNALGKILSLRGTTYNYLNEEKETDTTKLNYGLIAQELKEVLPDLVSKHKFDNEYNYVIDYKGLLPVIIEAFKEQNIIIEKMKKDIEELKEMNFEMVEILKEKGLIKNEKYLEIAGIPILYQNIPNPFNTATEIEYYLPNHIDNAFIMIMDMNGKSLKRINIYSKGKSKIVINANELNSGMYIYTLVTDNQIICTKRMVLTE